MTATDKNNETQEAKVVNGGFDEEEFKKQLQEEEKRKEAILKKVSANKLKGPVRKSLKEKIRAKMEQCRSESAAVKSESQVTQQPVKPKEEGA